MAPRRLGTAKASPTPVVVIRPATLLLEQRPEDPEGEADDDEMHESRAHLLTATHARAVHLTSDLLSAQTPHLTLTETHLFGQQDRGMTSRGTTAGGLQAARAGQPMVRAAVLECLIKVAEELNQAQAEFEYRKQMLRGGAEDGSHLEEDAMGEMTMGVLPVRIGRLLSFDREAMRKVYADKQSRGSRPPSRLAPTALPAVLAKHREEQRWGFFSSGTPKLAVPPQPQPPSERAGPAASRQGFDFRNAANTAKRLGAGILRKAAQDNASAAKAPSQMLGTGTGETWAHMMSQQQQEEEAQAAMEQLQAAAAHLIQLRWREYRARRAAIGAVIDAAQRQAWGENDAETGSEGSDGDGGGSSQDEGEGTPGGAEQPEVSAQKPAGGQKRRKTSTVRGGRQGPASAATTRAAGGKAGAKPKASAAQAADKKSWRDQLPTGAGGGRSSLFKAAARSVSVALHKVDVVRQAVEAEGGDRVSSSGAALMLRRPSEAGNLAGTSGTHPDVDSLGTGGESSGQTAGDSGSNDGGGACSTALGVVQEPWQSRQAQGSESGSGTGGDDGGGGLGEGLTGEASGGSEEATADSGLEGLPVGDVEFPAAPNRPGSPEGSSSTPLTCTKPLTASAADKRPARQSGQDTDVGMGGRSCSGNGSGGCSDADTPAAVALDGQRAFPLGHPKVSELLVAAAAAVADHEEAGAASAVAELSVLEEGDPALMESLPTTGRDNHGPGGPQSQGGGLQTPSGANSGSGSAPAPFEVMFALSRLAVPPPPSPRAKHKSSPLYDDNRRAPADWDEILAVRRMGNFGAGWDPGGSGTWGSGDSHGASEWMNRHLGHRTERGGDLHKIRDGWLMSRTQQLPEAGFDVLIAGNGESWARVGGGFGSRRRSARWAPGAASRAGTSGLGIVNDGSLDALSTSKSVSHLPDITASVRGTTEGFHAAPRNLKSAALSRPLAAAARAAQRRAEARSAAINQQHLQEQGVREWRPLTEGLGEVQHTPKKAMHHFPRQLHDYAAAGKDEQTNGPLVGEAGTWHLTAPPEPDAKRLGQGSQSTLSAEGSGDSSHTVGSSRPGTLPPLVREGWASRPTTPQRPLTPQQLPQHEEEQLPGSSGLPGLFPRATPPEGPAPDPGGSSPRHRAGNGLASESGMTGSGLGSGAGLGHGPGARHVLQLHEAEEHEGVSPHQDLVALGLAASLPAVDTTLRQPQPHTLLHPSAAAASNSAPEARLPDDLAASVGSHFFQHQGGSLSVPGTLHRLNGLVRWGSPLAPRSRTARPARYAPGLSDGGLSVAQSLPASPGLLSPAGQASLSRRAVSGRLSLPRVVSPHRQHLGASLTTSGRLADPAMPPKVKRPWKSVDVWAERCLTRLSAPAVPESAAQWTMRSLMRLGEGQELDD